MGKKPLNENQVKTLRKLVFDKPLHSLLLNLGCDLMLRSSDLLKLKVSDVMNESGTPKSESETEENWKEYSLNSFESELNQSHQEIPI